jgi:XTP/dITP diphosphohydrolase
VEKPKLLLATGNPGKIREFKDLIVAEISVLIPSDLGLDLEVEETAPDYRTNASTKALAYAVASGLWSLADDSGLEVEALEGAPGLHSARLAGKGKGDDDRRRRLLELLSPHPRPWTAKFRSTLALASPGGELHFSEGVCSGQIIPQERGSGGFGYDPIFLLEGEAGTMAELGIEAKNRLSHRARAFKILEPSLYRALGLDRQLENGA